MDKKTRENLAKIEDKAFELWKGQFLSFLEKVARVEENIDKRIMEIKKDPEIEEALSQTREQTEKIIRAKVEEIKTDPLKYRNESQGGSILRFMKDLEEDLKGRIPDDLIESRMARIMVIFVENGLETMEIDQKIDETLEEYEKILEEEKIERRFSPKEIDQKVDKTLNELRKRWEEAEARAERAEEELKRLKEKRERRTLQQLQFDFGEIEKRNIIPLDLEMFTYVTELIPDRLIKLIEERQLETGGTLKRYERKVGNTSYTYEYIIPKEINPKDIPRMGELTRSTMLGLVSLVREQGSNIVDFTEGLMFESIGISGDQIKMGGHKFNDIINVLQTLVSGTYIKENKGKGKKYRKKIGHILNEMTIEGKGRGRIITVDIPQDTIHTALRFAKGDKADKKYISIPKKLALIRGSGYNHYQKRYLFYISGLSGLRNVYGIYVENLLTKKLLISRTKLTKSMGKDGIIRLLTSILKAGKEEGLLKNHEFDYKGKPKDPLKWWLKQWVTPAIEVGEEKPIQKPTQIENITTEDIVRWLTDTYFKTRTPPEKVHIQVEGTKKKYGAETVNKIFKEEANALNAHPKNFWNRIKELKARRKLKPLFE